LISAPSFGYLNTVRADAAPPLLPGATVAPNAVVINAAEVQSLTWTKGQAYPVVNGNPTPPPDAPSIGVNSTAPTSYGGHWYAGSVVSGTASLQTWALAEISVPSASGSSTSEFYYVLLSIWDNAGSYDQVGFSGDYGVWGLTYSYTSGPCTSPTYHYNPDYFSLASGQMYLLAITTQNGGTYDEVYTVSTTGGISEIFSLFAPTGASNPGLEKEPFYCGYYDYTDYEEVYGTTSYTQPNPYGAPGGFTWYFHGNCYGSSGCNTYTTWTAWKTSNAPPGTAATIGRYKGYAELVTVENFKCSTSLCENY